MAGTRLSAEEREEIRVGLDRDVSCAEVARWLGRPTSTVSREVERNGGRSGYCAVAAERRAVRERGRARPTMFQMDVELAERVTAGLVGKDSPMTIAIAEGISVETIYQAVYANGGRGLRAGLGCHLHRRRRRRKRRVAGEAKKAGPLGKFRSISLRPSAADDREEVGHLEGDLIIGQAGASAVITLIDRATSFSLLGSLPHGHTSSEVAAKVGWLLRRELLPEMAQTLTWDQGREMANWELLEARSDITVYFADPHAPWQRPVNENFNGLLRRWLPKGTDLSRHDQDDLDAIAHQINHAPRRSLGWDTPAQHHYDALVALTA